MIEFKNVSFSYKTQENQGVKNISLMINDGETVFFCGESGCSKSTFLRLVNGLIPHYYDGNLSGQLLLNGKDITKEPLYEIAKQVGSVFKIQELSFLIQKQPAKLYLLVKIWHCHQKKLKTD